MNVLGRRFWEELRNGRGLGNERVEKMFWGRGELTEDELNRREIGEWESGGGVGLGRRGVKP